LSLLEVRDLHVWFDLPQGPSVHAAAGVSFALAAGERFGLVGESGCGKTTTILALMGLLPPNASLAGEVLVDGRNILAEGEDSVRGHRWKDLAMVFQGAMNAMNPVKKIGWQIAEPMAFHGIAQGAAARRGSRRPHPLRTGPAWPRTGAWCRGGSACGRALPSGRPRRSPRRT
jgi:peptide/nickel transport system ATP-binding protein